MNINRLEQMSVRMQFLTKQLKYVKENKIKAELKELASDMKSLNDKLAKTNLLKAGVFMTVPLAADTLTLSGSKQNEQNTDNVLSKKFSEIISLHKSNDYQTMTQERVVNSPLTTDTVSLSSVAKNQQINVNAKIANDSKLKSAKEFLKQGNSNEALKQLGFETSQDESGNITIKNGYSPILYQDETSTKTFGNFKIDEKKLLQNVVKIEGDAIFQDDFVPDHYIETDTVSTVQKSGVKADEIKRNLFMLNPQFQQALRENDTFSMLQMSGYDVEKDENGLITFNGNLTLGHHENKKAGYTSFTELGINNENLLNSIHKINGNLTLTSVSPNFELNPDIEVTGTVFIRGRKQRQHLKGFMSEKSASELYKDKNITPETLKSMADLGILRSVRVQEPLSSQNNTVTNYFSKTELDKKLSGNMADITLKALTVNKLLDDGDDITAFELLGYDENMIEADFDTSKITIHGDYVPYFIDGEQAPISYESVGINQDKLLENVVKITGQADFNENFEPDHYIEIGTISETSQKEMLASVTPLSADTDNTAEILKSDVKFQQAVKNNDTFTILQMCGYNVEQDNDGFVTFNGDLNFGQHENEKFDYISFNELGLNEQDIIDGIDKINGNLIIPKTSSIQKLSTDLEVTGFVIHPFEKERIFSNFYTAEDIAAEYQENLNSPFEQTLDDTLSDIDKNYNGNGIELTPEFVDSIVGAEQKGKAGITSEIINTLADEGYLNSLQAGLSTQTGIKKSLRYFPFDGKNAEFLDNLDYNRREDKRLDDILSIGQQRIRVQNREDNPELSPSAAIEHYKVPFLASERFPNGSTWGSFVSTIAWHLSPNTRLVMKQNVYNPYIHDVTSKHKEFGKLMIDLGNGKISPDAAKSKLKTMKLSPSETVSLMKYFKKSWRDAGTTEYRKGKCMAKEIARIYERYGIEGIKDEGLRERILQWEQERKPAYANGEIVF